MLKSNLETVKENIRKACERAGRKEEEVQLIAVSKTKPVSDIMEVYSCGQRLFGENKVQEMCSKMDELPADISWHLIGHLQTNKVKYITGRTALIHSVDSLHLAEAISREAVKKGVSVPVLIEVNIAEEESKFGVKAQDLEKLVEQASILPGIKIQGLMTIAPYVEDPEENRPIFRKLKQLSVDIDRKKFHNVTMNALSMGMTNDYEVAVEEGATFVRVGTAIFGARNYGTGEI